MILEHKDYSFFHCREWAKVLINSYKYTPQYFLAYQGGELCGIVPLMLIRSWMTGKRAVSLPFSDFCGPLFKPNFQPDEMIQTILEICKKEKMNSVEFRTSNVKFPFNSQEFRTDLRHILKLNKNEPDLLKSFSENTKRNIKKAIKKNVKVFVKNEEAGLNIFYNMFCATRQKHGLPPQPFIFFKNIYEHIIKKGYGDIVLAEHNNNIIAGAVYFKFDDRILYKFGASYPKFNELRGNNAVMWFAIQKYLNENY
ncbi:MAG: peptidoglycan bridge formation glycyltransferase FemA/FemB family protein, partial [Ignavibacteriaceae bacterium]|nr:peptidoglycan bridge formation glycyltransferase FemA/FemB family protein [Ignavibacteriaceae bacterium]